MPELPDLAVYLEHLQALVVGQPLERITVHNPFVLRTVSPGLDEFRLARVIAVRRIGKQLVLCFEHELFSVIHLMIAGRLRWRDTARPIKGRHVMAAFQFPHGVLYLTEAGSTRRCAISLVKGEESLFSFDRGGLEPFEVSVSEFAARLRSENHTVKRALTDPRLFSGIGNAYSDEMLHAAGLSPLLLTRRITDDEVERLFESMKETLEAWTARLRQSAGDQFPDKVTAFHEEMSAHGKFGLPCSKCHSPIQRIRYSGRETNYCVHCQTGDRLLADRALSRLLKQDWPRSLDDLDY